MPSGSGGVPVETLRAAVRAYAEDVGFRTAADAVGMSLGGLHAFINGTVPHERTVRKLMAWYARTMEERGDPLTADLARSFVAGLLSGIPEKKRADAERRLLEFVAELRREAGVRLPG